MASLENLETVITDRLNEMIESRFELIKNAQFLSVLGIDNKTTSAYYIGHCIESVAEQVINELCTQLTRQHSNGTPARISVDTGLYKIISDRYSNDSIRDYYVRHSEGDLNEDKKLVSVYLSYVDFAGITQSIKEQIKNLESEGLSMLATSIVDEFGLKHFDRHFSFYAKSGWFICQTYAPNWNHSFDRRCHDRYGNILNAFRLILNDTGIDLESSFAQYVSAVKGLTYSSSKIESRTVFGKGSSLQIACFKDKVEYRFTRSAFEALTAFLMLNGFETQAAAIVARMNTLQAA
ncbi:hypothetical protein ACH518_00050 (plasmid) [Methylomonas sp. HW2-6]|uniref:hypothetical protein n=1 Tax=Methylomonas sp. HW2-6 TaxID=3376687 RepID=UPI003D583CAB